MNVLTGPRHASVGESHIFGVLLDEIPPVDFDWNDGSYSARWANLGVFDPEGNLLSETGWEAVHDSYEGELEYLFESPGAYFVYAVIVEGDYEFADGSWSLNNNEYRPIVNAAGLVRVSNAIPEPVVTPPGSLGDYK